MKSHEVETGDLRRFGLLVGAVLAAAALWWFYRGKFVDARVVAAALGGVLLAAGALAPGLLAVPYRLWMGLAEGMSFVVTRVILLLLFVLVVTPIAFLLRLLGKDLLRRRAPVRDSYWLDYSPRQRDPRHYEKLY